MSALAKFSRPIITTVMLSRVLQEAAVLIISYTEFEIYSCID